jgi:gas vesicle protein
MGTKQPGSFSGIQSTFPSPQGTQLAGKFSAAYELLKKKRIPAAWDRLDRLDDDVKAYAPSLDLLQRHLPDGEIFIEDIEDACAGNVRLFNLGRTLCALLPLLLTWATLAWATLLYRGEPTQANPTTTQVIQSFLAQWQNGFGDSGSLFKFSNVAFLDAGLIIGVGLFTILVHIAEARPKQIIKDVKPKIEDALRNLLIAIEQQGIMKPSTAQGLVQASAGMISTAVQQLKDAAIDWKNTALLTEKHLQEIAKDSADTLKTLRDEAKDNLEKTQLAVQGVLTTLEKEIQQVIRNEMGSILTDYRATLTVFQDQVAQYKAASTDLVGEAKKLSVAGSTLAAEATAYTGIASAINTHMGDLKTSQTTFVDSVSGIATDMGATAKNTIRLVDRIDKTLQPELKILVDKAADTSEALTTTSKQLAGTTKNLWDASGALGSTLSGIPVSLGGGRSGGSRWLAFSGLLINLGTLLTLLLLLGGFLLNGGFSPTQPIQPTATPTTPTPVSIR